MKAVGWSSVALSMDYHGSIFLYTTLTVTCNEILLITFVIGKSFISFTCLPLHHVHIDFLHKCYGHLTVYDPLASRCKGPIAVARDLLQCKTLW